MSIVDKIKSGSITVEQGVPMPPKRGEGGYVAEFIRGLKIGDSFVLDIPAEAEKFRFRFNQLRSDATLTIRKEGKGSCRVWVIPVEE